MPCVIEINVKRELCDETMQALFVSCLQYLPWCFSESIERHDVDDPHSDIVRLLVTEIEVRQGAKSAQTHTIDYTTFQTGIQRVLGGEFEVSSFLVGETSRILAFDNPLDIEGDEALIDVIVQAGLYLNECVPVWS